METIYYYYYLFYTKVIPDDEPHATVIFTLSFTESWLVYGLLQIITVHFFCRSYDKWIGIGIFLGVVIINYFFYSKAGRAKNIIVNKPQILNQSFSIAITGFITLVSISYLFWGSFYIRQVLEGCE